MRKLKALAYQTRTEVQRVENELNLTDEEKEILHLIIKDKSVQQIADAIGLSERTVFRRLDSIELKLDCLQCGGGMLTEF